MSCSLRNSGRKFAAFLADMVSSARYEVLPTGSIEDKVLEHLSRDRTVTVTASPAKGIEATLSLTERLARAGYHAVPHLAARMVSGRAELSEICARMREAGVTTVFVPGGDQDPPAGSYTAALDLLADLTELGRPFAEVGITGYPESHPTISDDLTIQSMWDKRQHATHIVSNLSFDPAVIGSWVDRLRARGVTIPMLLGIPGPIDRAKLLSMATKIGVGDSTRFLAKHKGTFARLAAPGGFTGERFLEQCAPVLARPEALVTGLHVYTFNQVAETEAWRREYLDRLTAVGSRG
ncbi:MAG TPA: methylenetetrahydrofolate reductase [Nocardioidaceae bacterium]|jgi:methylenetetrahydrofolate reductase (NADPH)|nr:methylenetetrahydrofolate reductase [Nocardioidaceae bacterium]